MKKIPQNFLTWVALLLLALPTGAAGIGNLTGAPSIHDSFAAMGLPIWFGYFVGFAEVAGCIGLLIPALSVMAATCLLPIMAGAAYFHIVVDRSSPSLALLLLGLCIAVIFLRRAESFWSPFRSINS
ncbi:MAG: DoxX family protein [Cyanobacteria bacterium J06555_12]